MNSPYMSPRSFAYSGGERVPYAFPQQSGSDFPIQGIAADPREVPSYGVSMGSTPRGSGGGFLKAINDVAGMLLPIVGAARSFKAGYQGFPLPGRSANDARMGGDRFIFQVYQDMLARNEREAERARQEREAANQRDLERQLILEGVRSDKIPFEEALKALKTGQFDFGALAAPEQLPSQAPATSAL